MTTPTGRKFSRRTYRAPVLYAGADARGYRRGVMLNSCPDGMYFESDAPLTPHSDLSIKVLRHQPGGVETGPDEGLRARVKWCAQVANDEAARYGIGVQFTARKGFACGPSLPAAGRACDFCEQREAGEVFRHIDSGLLLCPDCRHHLASLPECVQAALVGFLLGNAV
jgi:hypothetical protein